MKIYLKHILIICLSLCCSKALYAQEDRKAAVPKQKLDTKNTVEGIPTKDPEPQEKVEEIVPSLSLAGRYVEAAKEIELRVLPQTDNVIHLYMTDGAILERSTSPNSGFKKIADLKPFTQEAIKNLYEATPDPKEQDFILFAGAYIDKFKELNTQDESLNKLAKEMGLSINQKDTEGTDIFNFLNIKSWVKSKNVPFVLGYAYTDKDVQPGKTYYYRIRLNQYKDVLKPEDITYRDLKIKAAEDSQSQIALTVTQGDTTLGLSWDNLSYMIDYDLYIKKEGEKEYQLSKGSYSSIKDNMFNLFGDLTNYTTYYFKVYGNSLFGEHVLLGEAKGMPVDLTPPSPPLLIKAEQKDNKVVLEWKPPAEIPGDFKGYAVMRSDDFKDESFKEIKGNLSKNTLTFTDPYKVTDRSVFYKVLAIDTANNSSASNIQMIVPRDSIPPSKPVLTGGTIDSLGIVTIQFKPNKEPDLFGYDLYFANDKNAPFTKLKQYRKIKDNKFYELPTVMNDSITLKTLTKKIYYRVVAVDVNYNESQASDILELEKPDRIPPVSPVFTDAKSGENSIDLFFNLSTSEDVVAQYLYRKIEGGEYKEITNFTDNTIHTYKDTKVEPHKRYFYTLIAKDNSGLLSLPATPVQGKPYGKRVLEKVTNLRYKLTEKNKVQLTWQYPKLSENQKFVLYRSNKQGNLVQYQTTQDNTIEVPYHKDLNKYAVKVMGANGEESMISETITVTKTN